MVKNVEESNEKESVLKSEVIAMRNMPIGTDFLARGFVSPIRVPFVTI